MKLFTCALSLMLSSLPVLAAHATPQEVVSPDGSLHANIKGQQLWVVDSSGNLRCIIPIEEDVPSKNGLGRHLNGISFSPDNKLLITSTGWISTSTGKETSSSYDIEEAFYKGRLVAWDTRTGKIKKILSHPDQKTGSSGDFYAVIFSPDGRLLAAQGDGAIRFWDAQSLQFVRELPWSGHAGSLIFSPNGKLLLGGSKGVQWLIWDVERGKLLRRLDTSSGFHYRADNMDFSTDGRVIIGTIYEEDDAEKGPIGIWDVNTGKLIHKSRTGKQ